MSNDRRCCADERERQAAASIAVNNHVRRINRAALRAQIEALPPENVYSHRGPVVLRADVLALIDGSSA
jgi:hypothetical protein